MSLAEESVVINKHISKTRFTSGNFLVCLLLLAALTQITSCSVDKRMTTSGSDSSPDTSQTAVKENEEPASLKQIDIDIPKDELKHDTMTAVTFKRKDHSVAFKMMHNKDGGAALDENGKVKFSFIEDRSHKGKETIRVQDAKGTLLGIVTVTGVDLIELDNAKKYKEFALKYDNERVFKLKDAENNLLYKLKEESYGIKVEDGEGAVCGKVRVKEEKVSLKNSANELVLSTRSEVPAPAVACFAMDKLNDQQKYSLAYSLMFLRL